MKQTRIKSFFISWLFSVLFYVLTEIIMDSLDIINMFFNISLGDVDAGIRMTAGDGFGIMVISFFNYFWIIVGTLSTFVFTAVKQIKTITHPSVRVYFFVFLCLKVRFLCAIMLKVWREGITGGIIMLAEILALLIFAVMFILIVSDKIERHVVSLWCALFTIVLVFGLAMHSMSASTLNVRSIFTEGFWYAPSGSE